MIFAEEVGVAVAVLLAGLGLWAERMAARAQLKLPCPVCHEVVIPDGSVCPRCTTALATPEDELDAVLALRELAYRRERYAWWSQRLIGSGAVLLIISLLVEGHFLR